MRKSLLGPLALAVVFAVAGCGGSNRPAATRSSPTSRVTDRVGLAHDPAPFVRVGFGRVHVDPARRRQPDHPPGVGHVQDRHKCHSG